VFWESDFINCSSIFILFKLVIYGENVTATYMLSPQVLKIFKLKNILLGPNFGHILCKLDT